MATSSGSDFLRHRRDSFHGPCGLLGLTGCAGDTRDTSTLARRKFEL
jgi:hypothetical protein